MRKKKLLTLIGSICLSLVLTALLIPACAPAAPEEVAEEIAELEADLAASEKKVKDLEGDVSDLEEEIAALKKPAKVYRWEPACEMPSGCLWNDMQYWSDHVNALSDGRIVSIPSAPGAVCPVDEAIEAVAAGTTGVMMSCPSYYAGKVPVAGIMNMSIAVMSADEEMYCFEYFQDGRIAEIMYKAYEDRFNVQVFGTNYDAMLGIMSLLEPTSGIADISGRKFRCGDDHYAYAFDKAGAATVWAPSPEIYTMLATGVVDGFTFGGAADHYALSAHEVAPYWLTNCIGVARCNHWVINRDVWNELPDDLKSLITAAVDAASGRGVTESYVFADQSWEKAIAEGVIPVTWPEEDLSLWMAYEMEFLDKYEDDPEASEVVEILRAFARYKGRL